MSDGLAPAQAASVPARPGPASGLARRRLLAAAGAAACCLPHRARAATTSLRMGYTFGPSSHFGQGTARFATMVSQLTQGRYSIEQYPDGALGGELEMLDGLASGEIDLALVSGAPLANLVPEFGIFDIPFLFRDAAHAHAVLDGPIGHDYLAMLASKQVVALAWAENGMRHVTNALRPVHGPADLLGMHLRVPQSEVMMRGFQALGARPEQLAFPALYGALESGRFDGEENPISVIDAAGFARVQKHLSLTRHIYSSAVFFMSQDAWATLAAADRSAFAQAAAAGGIVTRQVAGEADRTGVAHLQAQGMAVVADIDRAAFVSVLAPAFTQFEKQFGAGRVRSIQAVPTA